MIFNKKILIIILPLTLLGVVGYLIISRLNTTLIKSPPATQKRSAQEIKSEDVLADLNGDGKKETLRLSYTNSENEPPLVISLVALDENGMEIGRLPNSMQILVPFSNSGKAYPPNDKDKLEFVSYTFMLGTHSSETMFFGLQEEAKQILPVCLTEDVTGPGSCMFWSGEVGELLVKDLNNDSILEVVETVDEYPSSGTLTQDEETAINKTTADLQKNENAGFKRIAMREKGGRGRKVVWGIYKFNGNIFEPQTGEDYEKYYPLAVEHLKATNPAYPEIIKRTEMTRDSEDYNLFMRKFWNQRNDSLELSKPIDEVARAGENYQKPCIPIVRLTLNAYIKNDQKWLEAHTSDVKALINESTWGLYTVGLDSFDKDYYLSKFIVLDSWNETLKEGSVQVVEILFIQRPDRIFRFTIFEKNNEFKTFLVMGKPLLEEDKKQELLLRYKSLLADKKYHL